MSLPGLSQVLGLSGGCLALARGKALLVNRSGKRHELVSAGARATWRDDETILVAAERVVQGFSITGTTRTRVETDVGVTAVASGQHEFILGYRNGNLEIVSARTHERKADLFFQHVPSSPVERIMIDPQETLFVGFASGDVGTWSAENGKRLHHGRLHGPVVHMLYKKDRFYAASEMGSHLVWDLRVLEQDHCELMREVWRKVPILWEGGMLVLRKPPKGHRCKASKQNSASDLWETTHVREMGSRRVR